MQKWQSKFEIFQQLNQLFDIFFSLMMFEILFYLIFGQFRAIKPEFKSLLSELCTEQILMLIKPNEVRSRKKQRKLGTEVADLKHKLSQSNKNIVLSNREIRLLR